MRKGIVELVARLARGAGHRAGRDDHERPPARRARRAARAPPGSSAVNVSLDTLDPERVPRAHRPRRSRARARRHRRRASRPASRVKTNAVALARRQRRRARRAVRRTRGRAARCRGSSSTCRCPTARSTTPPPSSSAADDPRARSRPRSARSSPAQRAGADAGPGALLARSRRSGREVGIISAMTEHFCDDCNRLRLTATGDAPRVPRPRRRDQPARRRARRRQRRRPRARDRRRGHRASARVTRSSATAPARRTST